MYLDSINIYNIGPIDKCIIKPKFDENGNPYPIVVIGDNGKGKTILSSYIADAIIELAKSHSTYNNVVEHAGAYYKIIGQTNIKNGKKYGITILSFNDENKNFTYVEKAGTVNLNELENDLEIFQNKEGIRQKLMDKENSKEILNISNKEEVERYFNDNVLCFFPSYRSEKPIWMNESAIKYNEIYDHEKYNGKLNKEIIIDHSEERNTQWINSVIVDSLIDIVSTSENNYNINGNVAEQQLLRKAKENLEIILKKIFKCNSAKLQKKYRNQTNSFRIVCNEIIKKEKNVTTSIDTTVNSLKHFSLGQAVLFNMFSTIIRHADINDIMKSIKLSDITGIVIIDEIDMHLDSEMQYEVLPKLLKLFPKIQFIITTHSPLFLLGMDKELENKYMLVEMPKGIETTTERFSEFENSYKYLNTTKKHEEEINAILEKNIQKIENSHSKKALVITEGPTDWRHIKVALNKFREQDSKYLDLDFEFLEYDDNFGEGELVKMKDSLLKLPNQRRYILIADQDTNNKDIKLFNNDNGDYKNWGNNVFTFRIPVPENRTETPNISIEHYYTDEEIKTTIVCDDSIERRLYMGKDFNKLGLNVSNGKRCDYRNKCGKNKITILSGCGDEKVYNIEDEDGSTTNFALSKKDFVEKVVNDNTKKIGYKNFSLILDKIEEIINLDENSEPN